MFLPDAAAVWYDSLRPEEKSTFAAIKNAFSDRYLPHPAMRWANLEAFNSRMQKPDESVDDYVQDMLKRGNT